MAAEALNIRRARHEDRGRISEIRLGVKENILRDASRVTEEDVTWFLENPGIWLWVEDGQTLGFSAADTRDGTIWALFVDPAHERRGIGRPLFEKVCDVLRQDGHRTATLTTMPGSRAEGFYKSAGWRMIGTSPRGKLILHGIL
jgi:GNAT superfamily N-acetyltransferase